MEEVKHGGRGLMWSVTRVIGPGGSRPWSRWVKMLAMDDLVTGWPILMEPKIVGPFMMEPKVVGPFMMEPKHLRSSWVRTKFSVFL